MISPQITLWNQQGSQVIQGTLLVIPVDEALLYVRPLYLRASGGRIPELNRVIVAYKDQIVMADDARCRARSHLRGGAGPAARRPAQLTSTSAAPGATATDQQPEAPLRASTRADAAAIERARQHYERAMQAQRDGNWALYGEEIELLGETLRGMSK